MLRGSRDFADLAGYQAFLAETIARKNARGAQALAVELAAMRPLPRHRTTDFSTRHRQRHPLRHDQRARRALHRALAPGRLPAQGPRLRRSAGLLSRHDAGADRRAALLSAQWAAPAGRRLPPPGRQRWSGSRRPSGIRCSARSCSRARSSAAPGRRSTGSSIRARPAGSMSACCTSRRCTPARLELAEHLEAVLAGRRRCPTSRRRAPPWPAGADPARRRSR